MLRDHGYATAIAGKWQLSLLKDDPDFVRRMGFDEYCLWAWHEGPRYYFPRIWQNGALRDDVEDKYGPDVYCDFLIDFMDRQRDQPFLAYYSMTLAHFPKDDEPPPPNGRHKTYAEMVEAMDERVGRLVDALDALGLADNTLVLFTADNGTPRGIRSLCAGRKIEGGKGLYTDAGTRVPLIARWPGVAPANHTNLDLVEFSDFLPTMAQISGASVPADRPIDGRSFYPTLRGMRMAARSWVYVHYEHRAFALDQWYKLYSDGAFYHVAADPEETRPIAPDSDSPAARQARAKLSVAMATMRAAAHAEATRRGAT